MDFLFVAFKNNIKRTYHFPPDRKTNSVGVFASLFDVWRNKNFPNNQERSWWIGKFHLYLSYQIMKKGDWAMKLIENNIQRIVALCKKHKVHQLFVFGSILTNRFTDKSDVDMVVNFNPIDLMDYADNYFDLKYSLQDLLGRNVDLLEEKAIRNPILLRNINNTKHLVYG